MGALEVLAKLEDSGELDTLLKSGFMGFNQVTHFRIYSKFKECRKCHKTNIDTFITLSVEFHLSVSTIERVVLAMRKLDKKPLLI